MSVFIVLTSMNVLPIGLNSPVLCKITCLCTCISESVYNTKVHPHTE